MEKSTPKQSTVKEKSTRKSTSAVSLKIASTDTQPKKKKNKNYLNNKDMLHEWQLSYDQDAMTDTFSKMVTLLTKRYSSKVRFNVCDTFRDDMESFALMTVSKVWRGFDPTKSNNPFAYFTQVIKRGFYQFQNSERRHRGISNELLIQDGQEPSHAYMVEYEYRNFDPLTAGGEVTVTYGEGYTAEMIAAELELSKGTATVRGAN